MSGQPSSCPSSRVWFTVFVHWRGFVVAGWAMWQSSGQLFRIQQSPNCTTTAAGNNSAHFWRRMAKSITGGRAGRAGVLRRAMVNKVLSGSVRSSFGFETRCLNDAEGIPETLSSVWSGRRSLYPLRKARKMAMLRAGESQELVLRTTAVSSSSELRGDASKPRKSVLRHIHAHLRPAFRVPIRSV